MPPSTPLLRPNRYFAERDVNGLHAVAIVAVVTLALLATFYGIGLILAAQIDGTVSVDNPERPPDRICESDSDVFDQSGCDQPRTVERNVDSQIWMAWHGMAGRLLVSVPLAWLLIGALLHMGSWLAGGEQGLSSFVVAGWGLAPSLASSVVVLVVLFVTFDPATVTPANQETALEAARAALRAIGPVQEVLTIATSAWSAVIWRYGLTHERGLSGANAWLVAGVVAALLAIGALM